MFSWRVLCFCQADNTLSLQATAGPGMSLLPSPATEPLLFGHRNNLAATKNAGNSRYGTMENDLPAFSVSEICVTDTISSDPEERRLIPAGQHVEICLYDEFGNGAEVPDSKEYVCVCQVKHQRDHDNNMYPNHIPTQLDSSVNSLRLPRLEGANARGYLKGARASADTYKFPALALEVFEADQGSLGADGALKLVFSLLPTEMLEGQSAAVPNIEVSPYELLFQYTSDESHAHSRRLVTEQLQVQWHTTCFLFFLP